MVFLQQAVNLLAIWGVAVLLSGSAGAVAAPQSDWETDDNLHVRLDLGLAQYEKLVCIIEVNGELWIGSDQGLYWLRRGAKAKKVLPSKVEPGPQALAFNVNCLRFCRNTLWVGTSNGLYPIDPKLGAAQKPDEKPIVEGAVFSLAEAKKCLWIGTKATLYLWENWDKEGTRPIDQKLSGPINYLAWDEADRLWIATDKGILYREWDAKLKWAIPAKPQNYQGTFDRYKVPSEKGGAFAVAHPYKNSLWVQMPNSAQDVVRLENVMSESERSLRLVTGVGYMQGCLTVKDLLWIAATELRRDQNAPNAPGDGGLFRWRPDLKKPERVIAQDVRGLSRNGDTLWIAATDEVYRVNGINGGTWSPMVVLTAAPTSSFFGPLFEYKPVPIKWKKPKNLAGRTTPDLVRFDVFYKENGSGKLRKQEAKDPTRNEKGELEWGVTLSDLSAGDYQYAIHAYDFHDNEAIAINDPNDSEAIHAQQSFVMENPLRGWLTRLGPPVVILIGVILLVSFNVPLRRSILVFLWGYRYTLIPGVCEHQFEVSMQGTKRFKIVYVSAEQASPEHEVDLSNGWPTYDLPEAIQESLNAQETTIRDLIDSLLDERIDHLERQAEAQLVRTQELCTSRAQTDCVKRITAGLQRYKAGRADQRSKTQMAGILEECLREPLFFTSWLNQLRKGMSGQTILVRARRGVPLSLGSVDRQQVVGGRYRFGRRADNRSRRGDCSSETTEGGLFRRPWLYPGPE